MLTDLILAVLHHFIMFGLVAVLVVELMLTRPEITPGQTVALVRADRIYGILAVLMLVVGFSRVFFGLEGSDFYLGNYIFWTKIGLFALVGILSIQPTMKILRWGRALADNPNFRPTTPEIKSARQFMHLEVAVFVLIPLLAAMLGRGYGA